MSENAKSLIIAHRGASFDAPENTRAAFELAWQQGADGIETDIRLTSDGRIVCIHDEDTKRVGGNQQSGCVVSDTSYADLAKLDVGDWKGRGWRGEKIPALEDMLASLPDDKKIFIEMKTGPEIVAPLVDVLSRARLTIDQVLLMSFDETTMSACAEQLSQFRRHLLVDYRQQGGTWTPTVDEVIHRVRRSQAGGLGTQNLPAHVNDAFIERLHAGGIDEFQVWTVDDPETARMYQRLGARAITTNRPGQIRSALESR